MYVPEITFPDFPSLSGAVQNTDGTVTVPDAWLVRLAEYKIRIDETRRNYEDLRLMMEDKK